MITAHPQRCIFLVCGHLWARDEPAGNPILEYLLLSRHSHYRPRDRETGRPPASFCGMPIQPLGYTSPHDPVHVGGGHPGLVIAEGGDALAP